MEATHLYQSIVRHMDVLKTPHKFGGLSGTGFQHFAHMILQIKQLRVLVCKELQNAIDGNRKRSQVARKQALLDDHNLRKTYKVISKKNKQTITGLKDDNGTKVHGKKCIWVTLQIIWLL